ALPPSLLSLFSHCSGDHRALHSFPTRRSSDLDTGMPNRKLSQLPTAKLVFCRHAREQRDAGTGRKRTLDRFRITQLQHGAVRHRSEEHTSELQSRENLVCRLLLEKKKNKISKS